MGNKYRVGLILILFVAIVSIITAAVIVFVPLETDADTVVLEAIATEETALTPTATAAPTATAEPSATAVPESPKYIFYVIGDGMGYTHLLLGSLYEKILNEDSSYQPYWELFSTQISCEGGIESAKGGTMIATGYEDAAQTELGIDSDGNELVTILDRAEAAGMSTGVISNSYIEDATPASFLVHMESRTDYLEIANQMVTSDVDFIASGGMNYFISDEDEETYGTYDIRGSKYSYYGDEGTIEELEENGYLTFFGEDGSYLMGLNDYSWAEGLKIFSLFTAKNTSYQYTKYGTKMEEAEIHEPDLDEMTSTGIEILSQNENGFVFVIEEALIDKASHNSWMQLVSAEMHMLNKTLEVIYDFYLEHPYETLIIFTADHETGAMTYNDEFAESVSTLPDIDWHTSTDELYSFLKSEWDLSVDYDSLEEDMEAGSLDIWGSEEKNYTMLHTYIAASIMRANDMDFTSIYHSRQDVPLYALGVKAELFADCEIISDISPLVCEIMGWDALPESIED